jgi:hypothetical protein
MAGIESLAISGIMSLVVLGVILWFAFKHKFKPTDSSSPLSNPSPMSVASGVGTQPSISTGLPKTASSLSPPPVQKIMERNDQAWSQKATQPDPFTSEPQNEVQAKAKMVLSLLPYVRQYRSQGFTDPQIVELLQRNGWPANLIHIALEQA